ncbi:MAG TPA: hypothetical protein DCP91_08500 [Eggerthellaceae bacterium]|nr:hypothetical protein [Eggerthellaceae bacterium]
MIGRPAVNNPLTPKLLRACAGIAIALMAVLALTVVFAPPAKAHAEEGLAVGALSTQADADTITLGVQVQYGQTEARSMLDLVNKFRTGQITDGGQSTVWAYAQNGSIDTASYQNLGELTYDYELERVAMQRAAEIALQYSHDRPNGGNCFSAFPSGYSTSGENIAAGYGGGGSTTAQGVFESWSETNYPYSGQGHRRNMLGAGFNRIGIGHVIVHWEGQLTEGTRPYNYSVDIHYWVQEFGYRNDAVGLTETPAQDDAAAHTVDVEALESSVSNVSLKAKDASLSLVYGDAEIFDGTSCQVRLENTSIGESTWPDMFNMDWSDGAISKGSYGAPVAASCSLASDNPVVLQVSGSEITAASVGSANLTASTDLAHGAEVVIPVQVTAKNLSTASVAVAEEPLVYDGAEKKPAVTVTLDGCTLVEGIDYRVDYSNNTNATSAAQATVTGQGNYKGIASATFTIAPARADVPTAVAAGTLVYDGTEQTGVAATELADVSNGAATNAGTHTATATLKDAANYVWPDGTNEPKSIAWSIAPKAASVTSLDAGKSYGQEDPDFQAQVEGVVEGDSIAYSFTRDEGEDVGEYDIAPTGESDQGNYAVTFNKGGKLTISKAKPTLALQDYASAYTGEAQAYAGSVSESGTTAEPVLAYYSDAACENAIDEASVKNAGTYYVKATLAGDSNHEPAESAPAAFTIAKAAVTVAADDKSKLEDEPDPEFTAVVTGFIAGDDSPLEYTFDRAAGESVGTYAITPAGPAELDNYTIRYEPGTLTILVNPANLAIPTIVADNREVAMGKTVAIGASCDSGGAITYTSSNPAIAKVDARGVVSPVKVGTAWITVNVAATDGYAAASKTITVAVKQGAQSLSFSKQTKSVKLAKVKKAKQVVAITTAKGAKTKVSYSITKVAKAKFKKCFSINKSTGKITAKKKTPKGTYKVTVKATAAKTANWAGASKSAVITIKVK